MENVHACKKTIKVEENDTAISHGSGTLPVFATPAMIELMENAAMKASIPYIGDDETTVGTLVNVKHLSATPIGGTVTCEAELVDIDGRKLVFRVTAKDDKGVIGEGTHERFIVKSETFLAKALDKLN